MECKDCNVEMEFTAEEGEVECPLCGQVYCSICDAWMDNRYTGEDPPEPIEPDCGV